MSKDKSRASKNSTNKVTALKQIPLRQIQSQVLGPIYDKVQLLRNQIETRVAFQQTARRQQLFNKTCKQHYMEMGLDRDTQIQKMRKKYQQQHQHFMQVQQNTQKKFIKTATNWKEHNRNKTKSLINFLSNTKIVPIKKSPIKPQTNQHNRKSFIEHQQENEEYFEPVGEQYKREKMYQQSLKSQTQSLSSLRPQSSLQSSKIGGVAVVRQSSKKYLRKGTRVRQILMRQLQTPEQRGSSASSSLTYLKQYDQWVPTTLVEEKKAELQSFMNIIYGQKKSKENNAVDLNKINLIYL